MATRRVFVVSSAGMAAYHRHGSKLLGPFRFDADEDGHAEFARYLERFPDDITHVVADVVEEEFREEAVPHVAAWERRALLRTRAARAFPGARYLHAARIGREPDGRRDDRVRLSAITRPETLAPWLAPMAEREVPLAGIHSPAMLTAELLKAAGALGEHVLVASLQSGGGLRQTCFRHGKLRFSRLAVLPHPATGGHASHILAEIERTRRYLESLRRRGPADRLDIHVLSHGEPLEALRRALTRGAGEDSGGGGGAGRDGGGEGGGGGNDGRDSGGAAGRNGGGIVGRNGGGIVGRDGGGGIAGRDGTDASARYDVVDLAMVARRLGLRRWDGEATADRLFVHLLASRARRNHYATPEQTRRHSALRLGLVLKTASAAIATGACLFGGAVALEGAAARGHARALALHAALYERRYHAAQAALPPAPAAPAELERVVSMVNALRRRRADPVDLLARLSGALADFPRVRIEALSWRASDDPEAPVGAQGRDHTGTHYRPAESAASSPGVGTQGHDRTETRLPGGEPRRDPRPLFQAARFSARIEPFDGDYRAAIDTVRRLADTLAAHPGVEHVRILSLPLELGSEHALTGAAGTTGGEAAFEMRVTLRADVSGGTET